MTGDGAFSFLSLFLTHFFWNSQWAQLLSVLFQMLFNTFIPSTSRQNHRSRASRMWPQLIMLQVTQSVGWFQHCQLSSAGWGKSSIGKETKYITWLNFNQSVDFCSYQNTKMHNYFVSLFLLFAQRLCDVCVICMLVHVCFAMQLTFLPRSCVLFPQAIMPFGNLFAPHFTHNSCHFHVNTAFMIKFES